MPTVTLRTLLPAPEYFMNFVVDSCIENVYSYPRTNNLLPLQQLERDKEEVYRRIFAATGLRKSHFTFPVFVSDRPGKIGSMPGMSVTPVEKIEQHIQSVIDDGVSSII